MNSFSSTDPSGYTLGTSAITVALLIEICYTIIIRLNLPIIIKMISTRIIIRAFSFNSEIAATIHTHIEVTIPFCSAH